MKKRSPDFFHSVLLCNRYSAFENSTPLFFFSSICVIRSTICAAASTGGTPCLLMLETTVYSDSSISGLA